jgi:SAM-dependent methyltransferase
LSSDGHPEAEREEPVDLKAKTIQDFGEQWTAFRESPAYYGSVDLLADLFGPLLSLDDVKASRVADIGSGAGRIVSMLLEAGAHHVYAVEPSAAMTVLRENTARYQRRVTYVDGPGESLPSNLNLDLVVAIGVLHHIPEPQPVVQAAYQALRPGGRCLVWLYGREGNEKYLLIVELLRKLTVRVPHKSLTALSSVLGVALDAYIAMCRFLPLPMRSYMREVLARFPKSARRLTIYDQLNPAYAKYYSSDEAKALLADNGFADVRLYHRHGYSWTVAGRRPEQEV